MRYVDCTITIREKIVEFKPPYGKGVSGELYYSDVAALTIEHLNTLVGQNNNCGLDLLKLLGLHLYGILFGSKDVREAFEEAYKGFAAEVSREDQLHRKRGGVSDLRFRLNLFFADRDSKLTHLPWEFLFMPLANSTGLGGYFLTGHSKDLILTRRLSDKDQLIDPDREALKDLVVCCQPRDLEDIETSAQDAIKAIKELEDGTAQRVQVRQVKDPTFSKVRKEMEWRPHVFHFIGHGLKGELAFLKEATDIDLNDETPGEKRPTADWISTAGIMGLFDRPDLRMVFLHACNSASSTSTTTITSLNSFRDMARTIAIEADVPVVIAMQYKIQNQEARKFVKTFYEQIGAGMEVDEAVKVARYELGQGAGSLDFRRFGTPVVYMHCRDSIILPTEKETTGSSPSTGTPGPAPSIRPGTTPVSIPAGGRMAAGAASNLSAASPSPGAPATATMDRFDSKS